ncbi:hypothetical protein KIPB_010390, partial [Kipferlia bialata]|eukprot:g10390.t1
MATDDDAQLRARAAVDTCLAERYPGVIHHESLEAQVEFYLLQDKRHIEYLSRCRALPPLLKRVQSSDITECHPSLPLPSDSLFVRAVPLTRESILCPIIRGIFLDPLVMDARLSALMKFSKRYKRGFLQSHRSDGKRTLLQELAHRLPKGGISLPDGSIVKGVSLYLDCSCSGPDHVDTLVSSVVRGGVYEAVRAWGMAAMSVGEGLDDWERRHLSHLLCGVSGRATSLGIPHTLPDPSLVSTETEAKPLDYDSLLRDVARWFRRYSGRDRDSWRRPQATAAVPKPRLPILYVLMVDGGSLLIPNHRKERAPGANQVLSSILPCGQHLGRYGGDNAHVIVTGTTNLASAADYVDYDLARGYTHCLQRMDSTDRGEVDPNGEQIFSLFSRMSNLAGHDPHTLVAGYLGLDTMGEEGSLYTYTAEHGRQCVLSLSGGVSGFVHPLLEGMVRGEDTLETHIQGIVSAYLERALSNYLTQYTSTEKDALPVILSYATSDTPGWGSGRQHYGNGGLKPGDSYDPFPGPISTCLAREAVTLPLEQTIEVFNRKESVSAYLSNMRYLLPYHRGAATPPWTLWHTASVTAAVRCLREGVTLKEKGCDSDEPLIPTRSSPQFIEYTTVSVAGRPVGVLSDDTDPSCEQCIVSIRSFCFPGL